MTKVAVVGLGKIGLPLAAWFAGKGADVIGCDTNPAVVEAVNAGRCHVIGEAGLEEAVAMAVKTKRLRATTDTASAVAESDVVLVLVRVALDAENRADFTYLDAATADIARGLRPGTLVILETTVPVGDTRNHLGARLSELSGLAPGDYRLAYSPERVFSGTIFRDLSTYPKLVGGVDEASGEKAAAFYRGVLDVEVMLLRDAETAEFAKLAESVYRDVNIALANELALAAEGLGVSFAEGAAAANSQPHSHLLIPGVGVGGHCIPVYPYFLLQTGTHELVAMGRRINDSMAGHAVDRLQDALDGSLEGRTVLVLGLAYRGGVKESMLSSALLLTDALRARGARVLMHDPMFAQDEIAAHGVEPSPLPPRDAVDAVVLQAMHPEYRDLDVASLKGCRVFLDGRGAFDRERVEAAGMRYVAIGLAPSPER
jgi:nucleotide sugar dehydrogenase